MNQEQQPATASRKGYDFGQLTDRIIKAALRVHHELKSGFREFRVSVLPRSRCPLPRSQERGKSRLDRLSNQNLPGLYTR